jgi:hypothetical protein
MGCANAVFIVGRMVVELIDVRRVAACRVVAGDLERAVAENRIRLDCGEDLRRRPLRQLRNILPVDLLGLVADHGGQDLEGRRLVMGGANEKRLAVQGALGKCLLPGTCNTSAAKHGIHRRRDVPRPEDLCRELAVRG